MVKSLKQFGQNFLTEKYIAREIVSALELKSDDYVLEIGPGKGILTEFIIENSVSRFVAVEVDKRLIRYLNQNITPGSKVELVNMDFVKFDFETFFKEQKVKIIGNIPYNLTSGILYKLIDNYKCISKAVLMVQKEVADRIIAGPGKKIYGSLSVITGLHGNAESYLFVGRENFKPQPEVDSVVITIDFFDEVEGILNYRLCRTLITATFQQRRKMLRNTLRRLYGPEIVQQIKSVNLASRPEQISIDEFKRLANEIYQLKNVVS
jgi:16S rRNA (adenine1518-N6/adenine1519-N6)-dimethyltransferase